MYRQNILLGVRKKLKTLLNQENWKEKKLKKLNKKTD
jgi:hypothetical protein